jgi:hypothetical protein
VIVLLVLLASLVSLLAQLERLRISHLFWRTTTQRNSQTAFTKKVSMV